MSKIPKEVKRRKRGWGRGEVRDAPNDGKAETT